jgi:hypothetical protein
MAAPEKLTADIQLPNYAGTDPRLTTWRRQHAAPPAPTQPAAPTRTGVVRQAVSKAVANYRAFTRGGR